MGTQETEAVDLKREASLGYTRRLCQDRCWGVIDIRYPRSKQSGSRASLVYQAMTAVLIGTKSPASWDSMVLKMREVKVHLT